MSDVTYIVEVQYQVTGDPGKRLPKGDVDGLDDAFRRSKASARELGEAVGNVGGQLSDAFTGAVERAGAFAKTMALVGGGAALAAVTYGVAGLNNQLEQTGMSLAAIFAQQGFGNFATSTRIAADQLEKMKQDVKTLPGDLGDLSAIMATIATGAAQGGAGPDQIRQLAGRSLLVGRILLGQQFNSAMVSREMANLLGGRAGAHNILGLRLGYSGDEAKRFNKLSSEDRLKELEGKFNTPAMNEAAKAYASTWVAMTTTLKDNVKYAFLAPATSPLFESIKKSIGGVNDWFDSNKSTVSTWASVIGYRLRDAFEYGKREILEWGPAIKQFVEDAYGRMQSLSASFGPTIHRVGLAIHESLGNGTALDRVESILKLYGTLKATSAISSIASPLAAAGLRATGLLGGSSSGLGLGGMGTAGAAGAMGAGAGGIAGGLTLGFALAAAGIAAGVGSAAANPNSANHDSAVASISAFGSAIDRVSNDINITLMPSLERFGIHGLDSLTTVLSAIDDLSHPLEYLKFATMQFADAMGPAGDALRATVNWIDHQRLHTADDIFVPPERSFDLDYLNSRNLAAQAANEAAKSVADRDKGKGVGNIYIDKVEITVSGNRDPSRVAHDTVMMLADMRRNPTLSRHVQNFTTVTR